MLAIGAAFSDALRSYAAATPQGHPQQPPSLQELLKDPRFPNPRRHLRKIFVDPVTGKAEWGVIYMGDKVGVVGVHSLSQAAPLKIANFDARFLNMENKQHLSDWKFTMAAQLPGPILAAPAPAPGVAPSLFPPAQALPVPQDKEGAAEAAAEKAAAEKAEEAIAEAQKTEAERAEAERAEKAEAEKTEAEKAEAEADKAETEKADAEKTDAGVRKVEPPKG